MVPGETKRVFLGPKNRQGTLSHHHHNRLNINCRTNVYLSSKGGRSPFLDLKVAEPQCKNTLLQVSKIFDQRLSRRN